MTAKVLSGIDRLDLMDKVLKGRRLAVVTSGGAVDRNLNQTLDVLTGRYQVVRLFNTIYGVRAMWTKRRGLMYTASSISSARRRRRR